MTLPSRFIFLTLSLLALPHLATPSDKSFLQQYTGTVVGVLDGDTIEVLHSAFHNYTMLRFNPC
jgi:endonuclease YncB( thermonuclease family)